MAIEAQDPGLDLHGLIVSAPGQVAAQGQRRSRCLVHDQRTGWEGSRGETKRLGGSTREGKTCSASATEVCGVEVPLSRDRAKELRAVSQIDAKSAGNGQTAAHRGIRKPRTG